MKPHPILRPPAMPSAPPLQLLLLIVAAAVLAAAQAPAAPNIALWDTGSPLSPASDLRDRAGWKSVPSDLLRLETDPPKASSDPGFYGRDYVFKGDAVVENAHLTAVFLSARGRIAFYLRGGSVLSAGGAPGATAPGQLVAEFVPLQAKDGPGTISRLEIVRHAGDSVALDASFSAAGSPDRIALFIMDKTEVIEINPGENMEGVSLLSPVQYGIVPGFVGDALLFGLSQLASTKSLYLPTEQFFVGLLQGEGAELVLTWPKGRQQLKLQAGEQQPGKPAVESIDFENDGQSLYLAPLGAPGIWHREILTPAFLEKDVTLSWRPPFPAKWKTQLLENGVKTTFGFRQSKGEIWRGVAGSYDYPVWFQGQEAFFHLSKKVPPKGESLIYFLEGEDTPPSATTPVDVLRETLGRQLSDDILDLAGRKLRTHHRRGGDGVRRACTCGCTEAIQAVFEAGDEVGKRPYIEGALEDMVFFVHRHVERIDQYRQFADEMLRFLKAKASVAPDLKPFLDGLDQIARQIPREYDVQKDNLKSFPYADELVKKTLDLTNKKDPANVKAYMELLAAWRAMGGAQDSLLAQCHVLTRKLFQEAGYRGVEQPQTAALAREIRARCAQCLRNPDGYEIWADY